MLADCTLVSVVKYVDGVTSSDTLVDLLYFELTASDSAGAGCEFAIRG